MPWLVTDTAPAAPPPLPFPPTALAEPFPSEVVRLAASAKPPLPPPPPIDCARMPVELSASVCTTAAV